MGRVLGEPVGLGWSLLNRFFLWTCRVRLSIDGKVFGGPAGLGYSLVGRVFGGPAGLG